MPPALLYVLLPCQHEELIDPSPVALVATKDGESCLELESELVVGWNSAEWLGPFQDPMNSLFVGNNLHDIAPFEILSPPFRF